MTFQEQFEEEMNYRLGDFEGCWDKVDLLDYRYEFIQYLENKLTDEITENNRLRHELSIAEKQIEELVKSIK
jgi:hypothetical protein